MFINVLFKRTKQKMLKNENTKRFIILINIKK